MQFKIGDQVTVGTGDSVHFGQVVASDRNGIRVRFDPPGVVVTYRRRNGMFEANVRLARGVDESAARWRRLTDTAERFLRAKSPETRRTYALSIRDQIDELMPRSAPDKPVRSDRRGTGTQMDAPS